MPHFVKNVRRSRAVFVLASSVAALVVAGANAAAQPAAAGSGGQGKSAVTSSGRPPLHPPRAAEKLRTGRHRVERRHAKAAYMDPTGLVDSLAFCQNPGPYQQMTSSGGIISIPQPSYATTSHPYRVIPTVYGSQWIAFRIRTFANNGSLVQTTHWYWGIATSPAGYFQDRYSTTVGAYLFQDATTGQQVSRVDVGPITPNPGYGVRFTMDVAWYTGNAVSKQISFGVPWTTGAVGPYCWN